MNPAQCRHRTWQERVGGAISVGVPVLVALHLGASCAVEEQVGIVATELNIEAHVRKMATAEFVRDDSVSNKIMAVLTVSADQQQDGIQWPPSLMTRLPRPVWSLLPLNNIENPAEYYA